MTHADKLRAYEDGVIEKWMLDDERYDVDYDPATKTATPKAAPGHELRSVSSPYYFIHVPKTGGSTIKSVLDLKHTHISARTFRDENPAEFLSRYSFALFRNPWDHAWSWYKYSRSFRHYPHFPDWIRDGYRSYQGCKGIPVVDQWAMISGENDAPIVSEVFDFGRFQESFDMICDRAGIARREAPHINRSRIDYPEKNARAPYWDQYDNESRALVADQRHREIRTFGYRFGDSATRPASAKLT